MLNPRWNWYSAGCSHPPHCSSWEDLRMEVLKESGAVHQREWVKKKDGYERCMNLGVCVVAHLIHYLDYDWAKYHQETIAGLWFQNSLWSVRRENIRKYTSDSKQHLGIDEYTIHSVYRRRHRHRRADPSPGWTRAECWARRCYRDGESRWVECNRGWDNGMRWKVMEFITLLFVYLSKIPSNV